MPETIYELEIPYPSQQDSHLKIGVGACRLVARPMRNGEHFLEGTYTHPTGDAAPRIVQNGNTMSLEQGNITSATGLRGFIKNAPVFDLNLGTAHPYSMTISAGAYEGKYELGGLPLTKLKLEQGAGSVRFDFSKPNPEVMEKLSVETGAAAIRMENLLNANFEEFKMNMGAASVVLDFGGALQRETHVRIDGGMGSLTIIVPENTPAQVDHKTTLGSVKFGDGWAKSGSVYQTQAAYDGKRPLLYISVSMSLGAVKFGTS